MKKFFVVVVVVVVRERNIFIDELGKDWILPNLYEGYWLY